MLAALRQIADSQGRQFQAVLDDALRDHIDRPPMQIYPEVMQMFEAGAFDIAHLDPWLRSFAIDAG